MPAFTVGQPDSGAVKATQRQVWASADYRRVASLGMIMSELLCEALDLRAGQRVLDVGGGSGNAAIAAARRNTDVLCTALTTQLLEHAQARADAEGLPMQTQMADADHLPFPDASFEVVVSAAGAMFAPQQEQAASELARVCRSYGKIGLANWTPDGFTGQMFGVRARHVPPPPGVPSVAVGNRRGTARSLWRNDGEHSNRAAQPVLHVPLA